MVKKSSILRDKYGQRLNGACKQSFPVKLKEKTFQMAVAVFSSHYLCGL